MNLHKLRVSRSLVGGTARGAAVAHRENIAHGRLMALTHDMPHSPFSPIMVGPIARPMPGVYDPPPRAGGVTPNPVSVPIAAREIVPALRAAPLLGRISAASPTTQHSPLPQTLAAPSRDAALSAIGASAVANGRGQV